MKHKGFTVQELKENPSFSRMVRGIASAEEVENWNQWIESSDENRLKAKEALSDMVGFEFQSTAMPDIEQEWIRLSSATLRKSKKNPPHIRRNKDNVLRWGVRTVAVILLMSFAGVGTFLFSEEDNSVPQLEQLTAERTITTEQDEQKTLKFSNGSQVILSSNSLLTYRLGSFNNQTIEVTLEGEAWFDADTATEGNQPAFAVSTPEGTIRDIGTKFLVTVENGHSRVVLQEGLVEVEPLGQIGSSADVSKKMKFHVQKGEMVEFNRSAILTRKNVNPTFYSSWATGYMELNKTGLKEFASYVENRFGVKVVLNNSDFSDLEDITLNGTVYFRSLDELVLSVSDVTGIPAYRSADKKQVFIGEQRWTTNN